MRTILTVLIACWVALCSAPAQSAGDRLNEGVRLMREGDLPAARAIFEEVVRLEPNHPRVKFYLRQIATAQTDIQAGALKRQLESLVLPEVQFKEASLDSVLQFMSEKAKEIGAIDVNFVPAVDASTLSRQNITLSLRNVPFLEILRFVGGFADVRFAVETHAIVVRPVDGSAPAPAEEIPRVE